MSNRKESVNQKMEYRYPFFKEYSSKLLTVTSAAIVALITYITKVSNLSYDWLVKIGLILLGLSLITQLISSFLIYIGSGFDFDGEEQDVETAGEILRIVLITEFLMALIGIALCYIYIMLNI